MTRSCGDPAPFGCNGMFQPGDSPAAHRRARRLLRWYPPPWRDRYGAEFTELLLADMADRPRSPARTLDVARGGILARLAGAGLAGSGLAGSGPAGGGLAAAGGPPDLAGARARHLAASVATLAAAGAVFLVIGAGQWSQLLVSWVWTAPGARGAGPAWAAGRAATLGTLAGLAVLLALGLAAALPVLAATAAGLARPRFRGQRRRLGWPAAVLAAAVTGLVIGGRSVENNWTGTGGLHSPVPGGVAAFTWAVTLFVTAYWAHPGLLAAFPAPERAWMAVSPLLLGAAVACAVLLVRRAGLSPRAARFEAGLAAAGCAVMTAVTALSLAWLAAAGPLAGQRGIFHAGWVNVACTAVLALALLTGLAAARVARRELARAEPGRF
jgi:hypothetical protein